MMALRGERGLERMSRTCCLWWCSPGVQLQTALGCNSPKGRNQNKNHPGEKWLL